MEINRELPHKFAFTYLRVGLRYSILQDIISAIEIASLSYFAFRVAPQKRRFLFIFNFYQSTLINFISSLCQGKVRVVSP